MRILISGRTGQVARALAEVTKQNSDTVVCLGRPELDLSDRSSIQKALDRVAPDIVINAAAYTAVDAAETNEIMAHAVNADGPAWLAEESKERAIPIIHFSTDYVFDGTKETQYLESDAVAPLGIYGKTKQMGEQGVSTGNPNHVILRTAWVYSPFGKNFIKTMLRLASDRDEISVVADQRGAPTNALDLAHATLSIAEELVNRPSDAPLGIFHMTGTPEAVWADFAEHIFDISGPAGGPTAHVRRITTAEYPTPAKRPANSVLDCSRLASAYDLELPDWRDSAARCVQRIIDEGGWRE